MILDISGSMENYYNQLIDMANQIIEKQMKNKKNEGVVIFFANKAKIIIDKEYKKLEYNQIKYAKDDNIGGGTNFIEGFKAVIENGKNCDYLEYGKKFDLKRVLFLTDGNDSNYNKIKDICDKMKNLGYKLNIIGLGDLTYFQNLENFASENCFYVKEKFEDVKEICVQAFAA